MNAFDGKSETFSKTIEGKSGWIKAHFKGGFFSVKTISIRNAPEKGENLAGAMIHIINRSKGNSVVKCGPVPAGTKNGLLYTATCPNNAIGDEIAIYAASGKFLSVANVEVKGIASDKDGKLTPITPQNNNNKPPT